MKKKMNLSYRHTLARVFWAGLLMLTYMNSAGQHIKGSVIKGKVVDAVDRPIPFANVFALRTADSAVIGMTISEDDGSFRIANVGELTLILSITRIGYSYFYQAITISADSSVVNIGDIGLVEESKTLQTVTVSAKKPLIQFRTDRTILNVANSINSTGSTALELLRKAPGVRIGNNSDIIVNGKSGATVYIDGKLSYLSGTDLVDLLNNIQSSGIEAIEIIDKPSSKYDAAGNAGVINIKTKKNTAYGFNGVTSTGLGIGSYNPKYDGSLNLNFRQKEYNVYGSINYFRSNNKTTSSVSKLQNNGGNQVDIHQQFDEYRSENGFLYKTGLDLFISKKSTLGLSVNGRRSTPDSYIDGKSLISESGNTDSLLLSQSLGRQKDVNTGYNMNYRYSDTAGREFSIDADYNIFLLSSDTYQPNYYYNKGNTLMRQNIYQSNAFGDYKIYSLKSDYQARFAKGTIATGVKYSDVTSYNKLLFYNIINGNQQPDSGRTNSFEYQEKITAAYLLYNISKKKWQIQVGSRLEHTHAIGTLTTLSGKAILALDTSYLQLFPNLMASYNFNDKNTLGISYNRRLDRPNYADLNPFEFVIDELSYYKGNSFLRPQTTNTYSFTYLFNQKLNINFSYSKYKNYITRYVDTLAGRKVFETVLNLDKRLLFDLTVSYKLSVKKWLESNLNFDAYNEQNIGVVGGKSLNISRTNYGFSSSNTFIISPQWTMELSGYYVSKFLNGANYIYDPQWTIDIGVQNKVLNNRGIVRLAVTDIFNTLNVGINRDFGGLDFNLNRKWETRKLKISFTYKFGKSSVKQAQERGTSADYEKGRIR